MRVSARDASVGLQLHCLESSVRTADEAFDPPEELREGPSGSALVNLSLGSLSSADVDLMRRLVEMLAQTPHRLNCAVRDSS